MPVATAAILMGSVLAITLAVNVPINDRVGSWQVDAPPEDWAMVRDRWLTYQWARTVIGIVALVVSVIVQRSV